MKSIINGVRYDTETAIEIKRVEGIPTSQLSRFSATLYKTPRSGKYFIHGIGGMMTVFAGRERIIALSEEEARQW